ncbi:MAG: DNA starvation/stationary phase protection protein [Candidatus Thermoplasmatota archaeon]|nr:DNA starvation/stationary phase protection protein [Candidatus Thermoplasmatota archaeon]
MNQKIEKNLYVDIGIDDRARKKIAEILQAILADEYILYTETRNYHWNVTGDRFNDLHKFFESQYTELSTIIDDVAERIRSIGERPDGTLTAFLKTGRVQENLTNDIDSDTMILRLLSGHQSLIRNLRTDLIACLEKYGDAGTNNFLTDLMEKHEKMAWMLRSFLN